MNNSILSSDVPSLEDHHRVLLRILNRFLASVLLFPAVLQAQVTLSIDADVSPFAVTPGFRWRVFANHAYREDSIQRAEKALSGTLTDSSGNPVPNLANPNALGPASSPGVQLSENHGTLEFMIPGVINLGRRAGSSEGNFPADSQMPGVPAINGSTDGVSAEIIAYLELPEGEINMGINSDDGFQLYGGIPFDVLEWKLLGSFEGGRGADDTLFTFKAPRAGVYPFRVIYEQGKHDASIEWFTIKPDGTKVLVNDLANGGPRAYASLTCGSFPYPQVVSITPNLLLNQVNQPSTHLQIVLADGAVTAIDDSRFSTGFDPRFPQFISEWTREGNHVYLNYHSRFFQTPYAPYSYTNSVPLAGGSSRELTWKSMNLENLLLTNPVVSESFESFTEGSIPTGWSVTNYTASCVREFGISNVRSETYRNWVVINSATLRSIEDNDASSVNSFQRLNGSPLSIQDLRSGNILYAASNGRCNGINRRAVLVNRTGSYGQVQFIESTPFNLSTITNAVLSFGAGYQQNEDSMGGVEYSVNGGTNWLPVIYYLEESRIARSTDGSIDAIETFQAVHDDTALWVDSGGLKGQRFGDALKTPIVEGLDAFIAPRINDDGANGKRIEAFRLPAASKRSDVRLRFIATGSDSWYFFVDNIRFYDIATNAPVVLSNNPPLSDNGSNPPTGSVATLALGKITPSSDGATVQLNWTGGSGRYLIQHRAHLQSDWRDLLTTTNRSLTLPVTPPTQFYRVVDPDGVQ